MKIATWNVERLKHKNMLDEILAALENVNADILVLTETDRRLVPQYQYCFETTAPVNPHPGFYAPTENRVSIYTRYPCARRYPTYDESTSICVELETEKGSLLVYGTIIGIYGNRNSSFMTDIASQMGDLDRLSKLGKPVCLCGDYNCSFGDNYYFTHAGRSAISTGLARNGLSILTQGRLECIDHIALSNDFVGDASIQIEEWNHDKKLSDHKGISLSF